jgi:hypothetical protein
VLEDSRADQSLHARETKVLPRRAEVLHYDPAVPGVVGRSGPGVPQPFHVNGGVGQVTVAQETAGFPDNGGLAHPVQDRHGGDHASSITHLAEADATEFTDHDSGGSL